MTNDINSVYSDVVDVRFNMYNTAIIFQMMEDDSSNPLMLGKVKMSPQTFKSLHKIMGDNIETYERLYGEIPLYTEEIREKEKRLAEEMDSKREEIKKRVEEQFLSEQEKNI